MEQTSGETQQQKRRRRNGWILRITSYIIYSQLTCTPSSHRRFGRKCLLLVSCVNFLSYHRHELWWKTFFFSSKINLPNLSQVYSKQVSQFVIYHLSFNRRRACLKRIQSFEFVEDDQAALNPLTLKILLLILLTVCHEINRMLVWRIWNWINQ